LENYSGCQKYVPIELVNLSKVIASEAKQSLRFCKRLLRRKAPRNDSLSEHIFDSYDKWGIRQKSANNGRVF
ncbi:MAG: hypothetical protein PVH74_17615, partial [Desulfobacterales bacterium]|jgi:hypothetical protein